MIQAASSSTAQPGLIATLIARLFSGVSPQPAARRAPDDTERATLRAIATKLGTVIEGHGPTSDGELVRYLDRDVLEPMRDLIHTGSACWSEPHLGLLADALYEADGNVCSLGEGLIDRDDLIDLMADAEEALRLIARS